MAGPMLETLTLCPALAPAAAAAEKGVAAGVAQWAYQPALPILQVVAIAAVLIGLTVLAYVRTMRQRPVAATVLGGMRLVAVVLLAALLMGPSVTPEAEEDREHRPTLGVMVDTSASMQRPPHRSPGPGSGDAEDSTRFDHLTEYWLNERQLAALEEHFDVRLIGFDTEARTIATDLLRQPAEEAATGRATRYADALSTTLLDLDRAAGDGPAELIVLGDGHDSDDASLRPAAEFARQREIPVHTVSVGSEDVPPNVAVVALPRQDYLLTEEEGQLIVQVHQGGLDDASVTLHVEGEDERIERTVDFAGRRSVTVDIPIAHDEPGLHEYDAWVDPQPGEVTTENNRHRAFVEVLEREMRVLILEGEPYWDTKFLAQSLRGDARLDLTQITQLSTIRREGIVTGAAAEATVPRDADAFKTYDVVILGRQVDAVLDEEGLAGLREWVLEEGGQLVLARGRPYGPTSGAGRTAGELLGDIEPVEWHADLVRNVPLSLTAAGRSSPLFAMPGLEADLDDAFAMLPPMRVVYAVESLKPGAVVLARLGREERVGPNEVEASTASPAIVEMNVGSGRVLAVLGEGLWQWRLLSPSLVAYEGIFDAFWSNAVRYLAAGSDFRPGEDVSLQLGRSSVHAGDPLTVDVVLRHTPPENFTPTVTLTGPDGQTRQVEPTLRPGTRNRYRATVHPETPGVWDATLQTPSLDPVEQRRPFSVYQVDHERLRSEARPDVLRDLSERTGGLFFDGAEPIDLAERLERRRASQQVLPSPAYIWDNGLVLAMLVLWLGMEWIGRRRSGWL